MNYSSLDIQSSEGKNFELKTIVTMTSHMTLLHCYNGEAI